MAITPQNTYRAPQTEIDARFAEIARKTPDLQDIGREVSASFELPPDRTVPGGAIIDASRVDTVLSAPEVRPLTENEIIALLAQEVVGLRRAMLLGHDNVTQGS